MRALSEAMARGCNGARVRRGVWDGGWGHIGADAPRRITVEAQRHQHRNTEAPWEGREMNTASAESSRPLLVSTSYLFLGSASDWIRASESGALGLSGTQG